VYFPVFLILCVCIDLFTYSFMGSSRKLFLYKIFKKIQKDLNLLGVDLLEVYMRRGGVGCGVRGEMTGSLLEVRGIEMRDER
jgi:hypothetical protein